MICLHVVWPDHTEVAPQPFVSQDFECLDLMIEHLTETVVMLEGWTPPCHASENN